MLKEALSKNHKTKVLLQLSLVFGLFALFLFLPKQTKAAAWMEAGGAKCTGCIYKTDGSVDYDHVEVWLYAVDDAIPGATIYDKRITNASVSIQGINANECGSSVQGLGSNSSSNGRVGLRESCYHKMRLSASATGYDSITYDVNVSPSCFLYGHNGDVVDYYAHLIRNTPPPVGGITVTYTCLSDNTHVSAHIEWNANSSQKKLWVDKGADGTPLPPEITESSSPGTSIDSSTQIYDFGSNFNLQENTSNNFAVLTSGNQIVAQNRNNRALDCGPSGGNPPGGGTRPPPETHEDVYRIRVAIYEDKDGQYGPDDGGRMLSQAEAPNMHVYLNSYSTEIPFRDSANGYHDYWINTSNHNNFTLYFVIDGGWVGSRYSYSNPTGDCTGVRTIGSYTTVSANPTYPTLVAVRTGSTPYTSCVSQSTGITNYTGRVYLGVKTGVSKPNMVGKSPEINQGGHSFERTLTQVDLQGIVENTGNFPVNLYNVKAGFYVNPLFNPADSSNITSFTPQATATGPVSAGMIQALVYSNILVSSLSNGTNTLVVCADYTNEIAEADESDNCSGPISFSVSDPADQWLKTTLGDVGVKGAINMAYHPTGKDNADYLAIAEKTITAFTSVKGWLVHDYPNITTPSLSISPSSAETFAGLVGEYTKNHAVRTLTTVGLSTIGGSSEDIVQSTGDVNTLSGNYSGGRKVVFVNGNLKITGDLTLAVPTNEKGLIFIVSGNITIATVVQNVNAILITYGKFYTTDDYTGCGPKPMTSGFNSQLHIFGAVYSLRSGSNSTCFTRNLGKANNVNPAELITYEPKYLVLFRDLLGETVTSFKETLP